MCINDSHHHFINYFDKYKIYIVIFRNPDLPPPLTPPLGKLQRFGEVIGSLLNITLKL